MVWLIYRLDCLNCLKLDSAVESYFSEIYPSIIGVENPTRKIADCRLQILDLYRSIIHNQ
ncbi:MAG TPA: hypothetical protein DDW76_19810 [Cyanobacteria bacterium UBA11369]|nr:hypothetical protein [Cyanobacteria bacterium UBA11371]HBE31463.1 hypothetical protein [Cyanobacteria bacterium UBA11368]HBE50955.1 hypothetical protein [Cyanobacteria bacterium UBA11369]